jgi:uncharacterized membrane protein
MKKGLPFLIPITLLLFSVLFVTFNVPFYENHVPNYDVNEDKILNVLDFFQGGVLDDEGYTAKELSHMGDVRVVVSGLSVVTFFLLFGIFLSFVYLSVSEVRKVLVSSGVVGVILTILFSLLLLNFDWAFTVFHKLFFSQGNWQFPSDFLLIQLFPESLFIAAVIQILLYSFIFSLVLLLVGIFMPGGFHNGRKKT